MTAPDQLPDDIDALKAMIIDSEERNARKDVRIERLDDVLGALEEQLKALKKQARQATRYRNISDHIRRAEAISFHHQ